MNIEEIDKNMANQTAVEKDGFVFYSADETPIRLYGVFRDGEKYYRLPKEVAGRVSPGVLGLADNTAGGRVRFVTDSRRIVIIARRNPVDFSDHMPYTLKAGLDVYADGEYIATCRPGTNRAAQELEATCNIPGDGTDRLITVNMPLYGNLRELYVGIEEGASLSSAPDYRLEVPVVYYGSSITQGGCASRPGTCYQAILSNALNINYLNLGFSGNARGEDAIADYISGLEMSAFVYDYDHNAPTQEHLAATHERMYLKIRERHPDLPIIMLSRPLYKRTPDRDRRFEIIRKTYENALARGERVALINGGEIFGEVCGNGTVDGTHPTDLGFWCMARAIRPHLEELLGL